MKRTVLLLGVLVAAGALGNCRPAAAADAARVMFKEDDEKGKLSILVDGKEAMVYCYGEAVELPHYYPVNSPSGKSLTVEYPDPKVKNSWPHHRSLWFADTVKLAGQRQVSFYNAYYTRVVPNDVTSPARDRIRQVEFLPGPAAGAQAQMTMRLLWEMAEDPKAKTDIKRLPVLDELREMRVVALDGGDYFVDWKFTVTASYGDVEFCSDAVHYAWPFVRINPEFAVDKGGTMTNSEGGVNQKGTCDKPAHWVDDSNTVKGATEGLAMFSHPDNGWPTPWLTRDYGTLGVRRLADQSGKRFTLKKGDKMVTRAGMLVHRGDAKDGRVAERYQEWVEGKL